MTTTVTTVQIGKKQLMEGIAICENITKEAKKTLSFAMQGFTTPEYKKMAYLRERKWYWMDNGCSEEMAIEKAEKDYEWSEN